ncbi:MAG: hypothetical protein IPM17_01365 [Verrucomicrobia bacterium]|nr:hypothetical protein [Verrucomicrobiota bacterium]
MSTWLLRATTRAKGVGHWFEAWARLARGCGQLHVGLPRFGRVARSPVGAQETGAFGSRALLELLPFPVPGERQAVLGFGQLPLEPAPGLGLAVHDVQCGFKALTRSAALALLPQVRDDGWFFDTELLVLAQRQDWRTAEEPVRWVDEPDSTVKLASTIWRDLRGVWRLRRARSA